MWNSYSSISRRITGGTAREILVGTPRESAGRTPARIRRGTSRAVSGGTPVVVVLQEFAVELSDKFPVEILENTWYADTAGILGGISGGTFSEVLGETTREIPDAASIQISSGTPL